MAISRRSILAIMGATLAAPGLVRAEALMRLPRRPALVRGFTFRIAGIDQYGVGLVEEVRGLVIGQGPQAIRWSNPSTLAWEEYPGAGVRLFNLDHQRPQMLGQHPPGQGRQPPVAGQGDQRRGQLLDHIDAAGNWRWVDRINLLGRR